MTDREITAEMIENQVNEVNAASKALREAFDNYRNDTKAFNRICLTNRMNDYEKAKRLLQTLRIQKKASELAKMK